MNATQEQLKESLKYKRYVISIIDEDLQVKREQLDRAENESQKAYLNAIIEALQEARSNNIRNISLIKGLSTINSTEPSTFTNNKEG